MIQFNYIAKERDGAERAGIVEAADSNQAAKILRERGLVVITIKAVGTGLSFDKIFASFNKVSPTEITNFTRQLSTMITAGLPLTEALNILKAQTQNKQFNIVQESILHDIEGGGSFADSLQKHPKTFSKIYVSLVRAGEASGLLDTILARLAENLEKDREFKAKTRGAMIYPLIVVVAITVVMFIMMIFVIPRLTGMYTDMGVELPGPTKLLIATSKFFVNFWWLMIGSGIAAFFAYKQYAKTEVGKKNIDEMKYKIPVFGKIRRESALTEFARTLGLLVGAGIPIIESLNIVSDSVGDKVYYDSIRKAARDVEHGAPLSVPIARDANFPPILSQMIKVGEETGKLDEVLVKISKYFEAEAENLIKNLTTALEPFILIFLGIGVAFLVLSIILPIYKLTSSF
ncbi:MAG: type II secretion system F family protein [bacterium]|nr:type II secretion system F family protein [bacterium]